MVWRKFIYKKEIDITKCVKGVRDKFMEAAASGSTGIKIAVVIINEHTIGKA